MNPVLVEAMRAAFSCKVSEGSHTPDAAEQRFDVSPTPIGMRVTFASKAFRGLDLKHPLERPDPLFSYT